MTKGDRSSHLTISSTQVRFEALIAQEFGHTEVRRRVSPAAIRRPRLHDPATPVAWAAAAARRVARGAAPDQVIAGLGDLGAFCVAIGSLALLEFRGAELEARRDQLEVADPFEVRAHAAHLLPLVVASYASRAPKWWPFGRRRFAEQVLHRLAIPET